MKGWTGFILGLTVAMGVGIIIFLVATRPVSAATLPTARVRTYSNLETWKFIRDEEGRTLGVEAKRRAEEA